MKTAGLLAMFFSVVAISCVTPSETDRKIAEGHAQVALSLIHEADKLGVQGDAQAQDLKYREALRELLEGEKTGGLNAEGHYLLATVYFLGFKRYTESEMHLHKAIKLRMGETKEEYPEAENLLGTVLVDAGRPEQALPHFEKARTNLLYSTPYYAEQEMGWAYFRMGRHDEAARHLNNALVAQPDLLGAYVKLAEVEIARGNEVQAQETLTALLQRCAQERLQTSCTGRLLAPAYYSLGQSLLRTSDRAGALEAFRQCSDKYPQEPAAAECTKNTQVLQNMGG